MFRPFASALALALGLLILPQSAPAQPAGPGWVFVCEAVEPETGCGGSPPFGPEGHFQWTECYPGECGAGDHIDNAANYGGTPEVGCYAWDTPCSAWARAVTVSFGDTEPDSEAERLAALMDLWYLLLGAHAAVWALKQLVARQVMNT